MLVQLLLTRSYNKGLRKLNREYMLFGKWLVDKTSNTSWDKWFWRIYFRGKSCSPDMFMQSTTGMHLGDFCVFFFFLANVLCD